MNIVHSHIESNDAIIHRRIDDVVADLDNTKDGET